MERSHRTEVVQIALSNWSRMMGAVAVSALIYGSLYIFNKGRRSASEKGGWADLNMGDVASEPHDVAS